jgi:hypothetical protein
MGECFEGADQFLFGTLGLALVAPGNTVQDINNSVQGQELSSERLVPQTTSMGPKELGLEFSIPMVTFEGAEGLYDSGNSCTTLRGVHQGTAEGLGSDPRGWTLRRVHEV